MCPYHVLIQVHSLHSLSQTHSQAALEATARLRPRLQLPPACACTILVRLIHEHVPSAAAAPSGTIAARAEPALRSISVQQGQGERASRRQQQREQRALSVLGAWLVESGMLAVCGGEHTMALMRLQHPEHAELLVRACSALDV